MKALVKYRIDGNKYETELHDIYDILDGYNEFYNFYHRDCFILSIKLIK